MKDSGHIGGRKNDCPQCKGRCMIFAGNRRLTPYALAIGYVEQRGGTTLIMREGKYHVAGYLNQKWFSKNFVSLQSAREFYRTFPITDGQVRSWKWIWH